MNSKPQLCLWQSPVCYSQLSSIWGNEGRDIPEQRETELRKLTGKSLHPWCWTNHPRAELPTWIPIRISDFLLVSDYWIICCSKAPIPQLEAIARQWTSSISHLAAGLKRFFPSDSKNCSPTLSAPHASYVNLGAEKERTRDHPFSF